jgi:hypothetical protein
MSTQILGQRHQDSIRVNNKHWAVYKNNVFTFDGEIVKYKGDFIYRILDCLNPDTDNLIWVEDNYIYYYPLWVGSYYMNGRNYLSHNFVRGKIAKKINKWINVKKLAH